MVLVLLTPHPKLGEHFYSAQREHTVSNSFRPHLHCASTSTPRHANSDTALLQTMDSSRSPPAGARSPQGAARVHGRTATSGRPFCFVLKNSQRHQPARPSQQAPACRHCLPADHTISTCQTLRARVALQAPAPHAYQAPTPCILTFRCCTSR